MHHTQIYAHTDGSVAFVRRIDDQLTAEAWPLDLRTGRGLEDAVAFHQACDSPDNIPCAITLGDNLHLLIRARKTGEFELPRDCVLIGVISQSATLEYCSMNETPLRYFGFRHD